MSNEIVVRDTSGGVLYAQLWSATGQVWSTVGSAFEDPTNAHWGNYALTLTEVGTTGLYRGSLPAATAGSYSALAYRRAGGSPATTDVCVAGPGAVEWDGSAVVPLSSRSTFAGGAVASVTGAVGSVTGAVGSVTAPVAVASIAANAITAATIATDAIDADALAADVKTELQAGLSTLDAAGVRGAVGLASANLDTQLDALPTAAENAASAATSVWAAGTRTLTGFGTLVADVATTVWAAATRTLTSLGGSAASATAAAVWAYTSRTLTQTAAQIAAILAGTTLTLHRGDSLTLTLTGLGDLSTRDKLWFTLKRFRTDADAASLFQIEETAGLLFAAGAAAEDETQGAITVTDEDTGALTISVDPAITALLRLSRRSEDAYFWDVQVLRDDGTVTTLTQGRGTVEADVTETQS